MICVCAYKNSKRFWIHWVIFSVCGKKKKSRNAKHRQNVPNCAKLMTNLCSLRKLMFNGFSRLKSTFSSSRKFLHLLSLLSCQARRNICNAMGIVGIRPHLLFDGSITLNNPILISIGRLCPSHRLVHIAKMFSFVFSKKI